MRWLLCYQLGPCSLGAQVARSFELRRLGCGFSAWRRAAALTRQLRAVGTAAATRHLARTAHQVFQVGLV